MTVSLDFEFEAISNSFFEMRHSNQKLLGFFPLTAANTISPQYMEDKTKQMNDFLFGSSLKVEPSDPEWGSRTTYQEVLLKSSKYASLICDIIEDEMTFSYQLKIDGTFPVTITPFYILGQNDKTLLSI